MVSIKILGWSVGLKKKTRDETGVFHMKFTVGDSIYAANLCGSGVMTSGQVEQYPSYGSLCRSCQKRAKVLEQVRRIRQ